MAHKIHYCPCCNQEIIEKFVTDPLSKKKTRTLVRKDELVIPAPPLDPLALHYEALAKRPTEVVQVEVAAVMGGGLVGDAGMMERYAEMSRLQA